MTVMLKVWVGVILSSPKQWILLSEVIMYIFCSLFSKKPHKTSKNFEKYQSLLLCLWIVFWCNMTTMLPRHMRKQLDKVLQKRKQGGLFNGQGVELLKMDLENIASIHSEE